jgi:sterol desaturase/sphingolipid hydroxylase (fatty acid hydroxylase superfamily)
MVLKFIKANYVSYVSQTLAMLVFSFFVYAYTSEIGLSHPLQTLQSFISNAPSFFKNLIIESTYNYLFFLPFVIIPLLLFWIFFKRFFFKYRIQQIEKHSSAHFVHDFFESIFSTFAFVLLTMMTVKLTDQGIIKLYNNFDDHPWYAVPIAVAAFFVFEDTWFYWVHRAMHHKWIYKYVHASHHVSVDTSPMTQNAFNFVEGLLLPLGSIIPLFIFPSYGPAYFAFLMFGGTVNMIAHSGYEFYPKWTLFWKTTATHHNMHHQYFDGNYGTHFTFWDRICKTEFADYEERFMEIKQRTAKEIKN